MKKIIDILDNNETDFKFRDSILEENERNSDTQKFKRFIHQKLMIMKIKSS